MKCTTGVIAAVATATLAASALAGAPVQVFGGATETGGRFNAGPGVIIYNNCFVNSNATQLDLGDVVLGFRRLANSPAVDVECFATEMTFDGVDFNIGTEVSLGTLSLPASGATAVTELLTFNGTGNTLDLELVSNPGLGGFWIGFQTKGPNAANTIQGFRVVNAPAIGASINGFGMFNNAGSGIFEAFFGFLPDGSPSRFFVNVFGELNGFPCVGPAATQQENEPCGDDTNGGCNMEFPAFTPIANGDIYAGNYWAADDTRDTDWYQFTITETSNVNVELFSDGPGIALLVDNNCAAPVVLNVSGFGCPSTFEQLCLPPGTYNVVVLMTVFTGFPCNSGVANDYTLTFSAVADASCAPVCGTGDDCCVAQETPGCADEACCSTVCTFDIFCCTVAWDAACVTAAIDFCGLDCPTVCDLSGNDCCVASVDLTPGCSDADCCNAVCTVDVFCCDTEWDQACADQALELCGPLCAVEPCPFTCTGTPEGEPCGEDTNGGCNMEFPQFGVIACGETVCGTSWGFGGTRDTDWYVLTLAEETEITVSITNQLAMVIGVVDTIDCATATALDPFAASDLCGTAEFTVTLPAGDHWIFAGAGIFNGFGCDSGNNGYALKITCPTGPVCVPGPDRNGDGCINGQDLALVLGNWDPTGSMGNGFGVGDTNCDGVVDGFDLAPILGDWLVGCP